ncbi:FixH family protein [Ramlibacter sp. AN1015]|uniref:FixH family protein n=1 Tax=Ramlibacter sp. AN1015 TaxID=3133428 RepID=UPI0030BC42D9
MHDTQDDALRSSSPWWHHGHVWLVIAGPVIVVIAGIATLVLAVRTPDPLVAEDYYRRGIEINRTLAEEQAKGLLPAVQGRNHAASPAPAR